MPLVNPTPAGRKKKTEKCTAARSLKRLLKRFKRATVFAGPRERKLAWNLLQGGKRVEVLSVGEENGARLLAEAGKAVGGSRVRQSTRKAYDSGLTWVWPRFIDYVTGDGSTNGAISPTVWGLCGASASDLVDVLVQFQSWMVMEGLPPAKIKHQWLKT